MSGMRSTAQVRQDQMGIRVGKLDARQQERLRAALGETLATRFAYPSFYSFRADRALMRPLDRAKRAELASYAATIGFAPLERMEVDSAELRRYFEGVILRYLDVNPHLAGPRIAARKAQLRALARTLAPEVQRDLVAFLQGKAPAFGAPQPPASWTDVFQAVTRADPAATDHNTAALEAILARSREQPAPPPPPVPRQPARQAPQLPYGAQSLDAAAQPVQAPGNPVDDRQIFAQLRHQLEAYIRLAMQGYGLPERGGDPARALDDLRTSGLVDDANLRVAESILALTDRVTTRGSATIDDFRQALTLYLLYHRSHLPG
jgi:hypothetical protein